MRKGAENRSPSFTKRYFMNIQNQINRCNQVSSKNMADMLVVNYIAAADYDRYKKHREAVMDRQLGLPKKINLYDATYRPEQSVSATKLLNPANWLYMGAYSLRHMANYAIDNIDAKSGRTSQSKDSSMWAKVLKGVVFGLTSVIEVPAAFVSTIPSLTFQRYHNFKKYCRLQDEFNSIESDPKLQRAKELIKKFVEQYTMRTVNKETVCENFSDELANNIVEVRRKMPGTFDKKN